MAAAPSDRILEVATMTELFALGVRVRTETIEENENVREVRIRLSWEKWRGLGNT